MYQLYDSNSSRSHHRRAGTVESPGTFLWTALQSLGKFSAIGAESLRPLPQNVLNVNRETKGGENGGFTSDGQPLDLRKLKRNPIGSVVSDKNRLDRNIIDAKNIEILPETRHYVPVEIRKKNYEAVRERIFNSEVRTCKVSDRILKLRRKSAERRKQKRCLAESINRLSKIKIDARAFAEVEI